MTVALARQLEGDLGPVLYDKMLFAIDQCHRADEAKGVRDRALLLQEYARRSNNHEAELKLAQIRMRAERKAGLLLHEMEETGERHSGHGDQKSGLPQVTPILADFGISKRQSSDWQRLAEIPAAEFEQLLADTYFEPPTTASLLRYRAVPIAEAAHPPAAAALEDQPWADYGHSVQLFFNQEQWDAYRRCIQELKARYGNPNASLLILQLLKDTCAPRADHQPHVIDINLPPDGAAQGEQR